jgi:hypothetical protein
MGLRRKLEGLAAAFALAAAVGCGASAYDEARNSETAIHEEARADHQQNAGLYGLGAAAFGAAGLLEVRRLRRQA